MLANNRVRIVGAAIAVLIAASPFQAWDAAELIECDYDEPTITLQ